MTICLRKTIVVALGWGFVFSCFVATVSAKDTTEEVKDNRLIVDNFRITKKNP